MLHFHRQTTPKIHPAKTEKKTRERIRLQYYPFADLSTITWTSIPVSMGDVALSLSVDSKNLLNVHATLGLCNSLLQHPLGGYLGGNPNLSATEKHWRGLSQFVGIGASLAVAAKHDFNIFCLLKDLPVWFSTRLVHRRWKGNSPDYVLVNVSDFDKPRFMILEAKGRYSSPERTPYKFEAYKAQSLNAKPLNFTPEAYILSYTYLQPNTPLSVRWHNFSQESEHTEQGKFLALVVALAQFCSQLDHVGLRQLSIPLRETLNGSTQWSLFDIENQMRRLEEAELNGSFSKISYEGHAVELYFEIAQSCARAKSERQLEELYEKYVSARPYWRNNQSKEGWLTSTLGNGIYFDVRDRYISS